MLEQGELSVGVNGGHVGGGMEILWSDEEKRIMNKGYACYTMVLASKQITKQGPMLRSSKSR